MIYNNQFIWLHLSRCAGTKTEVLFADYFSDVENLHLDSTISEIDTDAFWHDGVLDRELRDPLFHLGTREIICSFRRLKPWLISRYNFMAVFRPGYNLRPELLLEGRYVFGNPVLSHADLELARYIPRALAISDRLTLIRAEHFEQDFKQAFANHIDLNLIPEEIYAKKENRVPNSVPQEILDELEKTDLSEKCPYWTMLEDRYYPKS